VAERFGAVYERHPVLIDPHRLAERISGAEMLRGDGAAPASVEAAIR
jgi:hypothetical protein